MQDIYGMLYFEPRYQETELKSGTIKLSLNIPALNDAPNKDYTLYCLILHEEEIVWKSNREKLS